MRREHVPVERRVSRNPQTNESLVPCTVRTKTNGPGLRRGRLARLDTDQHASRAGVLSSAMPSGNGQAAASRL